MVQPSKKTKFRVGFSSLFTVSALLVTWLIMGNSSPFHDYFVGRTWLPNRWGLTMFVPYLISAMIAGNPHSPSKLIFTIILVMQWSILGLLLSVPLTKLFVRANGPSTQH